MSSTPRAASPLRILVVNWQDLANPQAGGAEIHLHETFGRLARRGHKVHLLCSGFSGAPARAEADGMTIHRVGSRYTFPVHAHRYFRRVLSGIPFDVVVEDLNKVPVFTPRWTDAPVVALVHHLFGWTAFREANPAVAAATVLLEFPLPAVFRDQPVIAVSESTRDDLVERGFRPERITVIPNGVDLSEYHPAEWPGRGDGAAAGAGEDDAGGDGEAGADVAAGAGDAGDGWDPLAGRYPEPSLLYLGRLKKYKRVELILQALALLRDRGVAAVLRVGGRGDHAAPLRREAERLDLLDRVEFLGFVPQEIKLQLLRRSWVHVLTSPKEGWGIANLEAAACGTPTVASDSPGLRDSVRDGDTGLLVPHGDVPALADALEGLLADPERRARLSRGAVTFARDFSWDATARRVESLLVQAAAAGRPRRVAGSQRDP